MTDSIVSWPLDHRTGDRVGQAMKEHFRIEPCGQCGGPEVFSKIKPISRCFRCGASREHMAVKQHKISFRRCACCHEQKMAGVPINKSYCKRCEAMGSRQRAKQIRRRAERVLAVSKSTNESGPVPETDTSTSHLPITEGEPT